MATLKEMLVRLGVDASGLESGMRAGVASVTRGANDMAAAGAKVAGGLTPPLDAAGKAAIGTGMSFEGARDKVGGATKFMEGKVVALGAAVGTAMGGLAVRALDAFGAAALNAVADGRQFNAMAPGFERLAESVGTTGDAMLSVTRHATKGLIGDLDLMQAANKAVLLGLPVTTGSMTTMAKTATALGRAMGQDATKSLDDLITALGRSSPLILDNLGLTVSLSDAYEAYAERIGTTAGALTDAEKKQAFYVEAMEAAKRKMEDLGEVQLGAIDQLARLGTSLKNIVTETFAAADGSATFAGFLGKLADGAETAAQRVDDLSEARKRLSEAGEFFVNPWQVAAEADRVEADRMAAIASGNAAPTQAANTQRLRPNQFGGATDADVRRLEEANEKMLESHRKSVEELKRRTEEAKRSYDELIGKARELSRLDGSDAAGQWAMTHNGLAGLVLDAMAPTAMLLGDRPGDDALMSGNINRLLHKMVVPQVFNQGISDLVPKGFFESMFGGVKGGLSSMWKGMSGGNGMAGLFGNIGSDLLTGGLGSLMNMGMGLVTKGLGKLFGGMFGGEGKKANDLRDQIIDQAGGFDVLAQKAVEAGTSIDALLRAKDVKGVERAWAALTAQMTEHEEAAAAAAAAEEQRAANAAQFTAQFPGLLQAVAESGQLASTQVLGLIDVVEQAGGMRGEINAFVTGQIKSATAGITGFLSAGTTAMDTLGKKQTELRALQADYADAEGKEKDQILEKIIQLQGEIKTQAAIVNATAITSQAAAEGFAGAITASFAELQARGMSVTDALKAVAPAVSSLETQLEAAGLNGGAAFDQLRGFVALAKDEVAGPALNAVSSLNQGLVGLHNSGLLNQSMFAGLAGQVSQTFGALVAQGHDGAAVMQLMQPTLQTLWELQTDFGYQVDNTTQGLIDQAAAAGLIGDAHRDPVEKIVGLLEEMVGLLGDFIESLGGVAGAAGNAESGVRGIAAAAHGIPVNPFKEWRMPDGSVQSNQPDASGYAPDYRDWTPDQGYGNHGPVDWNNPNLQGWLSRNPGDEERAARMWSEGGWAAFAEGGIVTGPTFGLFGEAGPEAVMPLDRVTDFIGEAGADNAGVEMELQALRREVREFPRAVGIALQDALVLGGGL